MSGKYPDLGVDYREEIKIKKRMTWYINNNNKNDNNNN
jgi:hypothetical protein